MTDHNISTEKSAGAFTRIRCSCGWTKIVAGLKWSYRVKRVNQAIRDHHKTGKPR